MNSEDSAPPSSVTPDLTRTPSYVRWRFLTEDTTVDDFLYGNRGPYPQPAPGNPLGQLAEVIHLPKEETRAWRWKVSAKYAWIFFTRWPFALHYALTTKRYDEIDDDTFDNYLGSGLYSRFLQPLAEADFERFELDGTNADDYRKCDLTCMDSVSGDAYPGMYATSTITLLARGERRFEAKAIYLKDPDIVVSPESGNSWTLAKYFVFQGAAHRINLVTHAALHFPFDPINAVTKTLLPKSHPLLKLLLPHLYLSLPVNNAVLEGRYSLISRTTWTVYSPFVAPGGVIRRLLRYGYVGDGGAYPEYRFPLNPDVPESEYGKFLMAYYEVIHNFVRDALAPLIEKRDMPGNKDWNWVVNWADHCAQWVPGFPDGEAMNDANVLVLAASAIIWGQSVSHATDHDSIHQMRPARLPFRLRVPPPRDGSDRPFRRDALNHWFDLFKTYLTDALFYDPHNVTLLKDVDYQFADPTLVQRNREFRDELRQVEVELRKAGITVFSPLAHLPNSIQY